MKTHKNGENNERRIFWVNNEDDADFPKNPDNKYVLIHDPRELPDSIIGVEMEKAELIFDEKLDRSSIAKLKKILKISNRFRLDMLMDILDIDKKNLLKLLKNGLLISVLK